MVELLVAISVIALLAALLLPSLARAKSQAKRLHCANNLHHLGLALALYSQNYQSKYPYYEGDQKWEEALAPYYKMDWTTNSSFKCPSVDSLPGRMSAPSVVTYGYNRSGTDRNGGDPGSQTFLGLGGIAYGGSEHGRKVVSIPAITESQIVSPCDMFAIADSRAYRLSPPDDGLWMAEDYLVCGTMSGVSNEIRTARHGKGYNVVTCDGRATLISRPQFLLPSKTARNWNNDHQPHPETWPTE